MRPDAKSSTLIGLNFIDGISILAEIGGSAAAQVLDRPYLGPVAGATMPGT